MYKITHPSSDFSRFFKQVIGGKDVCMIRKNVRLLVLDENSQYSESIRECAEMTHHSFDLEVKCVEDEGEARELIKSWDPSVIILDAYLPKSNSFSMLEGYLAELVPVIMASSTLSREIQRSAMAKGAVGYVEKSENFDELESLLTLLEDVSITFEQRH